MSAVRPTTLRSSCAVGCPSSLLAIGARRAPGSLRATGLGPGQLDAAAKPRGEILLEYWPGQRQQARHSDNQRSTMTNLVLDPGRLRRAHGARKGTRRRWRPDRLSRQEGQDGGRERFRRFLRRVVPDPVESRRSKPPENSGRSTGRVAGAEAVGERVEHDRRHRDHRRARKQPPRGVVPRVAEAARGDAGTNGSPCRRSPGCAGSVSWQERARHCPPRSATTAATAVRTIRRV